LLSVSATTRSARPGEIDGVHYHFVDKKAFGQMIENRELIEYAQYDGNYYGTPRAFVEQKLCEGFHVILEIEVQGAAQVRTLYPEAVSVFVMPPSCESCESGSRAGRRKRAARAGTPGRGHAEIASARIRFRNRQRRPGKRARTLLCAVSAGSLLARIKAKLIDEVLNDAQTSFK
jgi:guanylate kinase